MISPRPRRPAPPAARSLFVSCSFPPPIEIEGLTPSVLSPSLRATTTGHGLTPARTQALPSPSPSSPACRFSVRWVMCVSLSLCECLWTRCKGMEKGAAAAAPVCHDEASWINTNVSSYVSREERNMTAFLLSRPRSTERTPFSVVPCLTQRQGGRHLCCVHLAHPTPSS